MTFDPRQIECVTTDFLVLGSGIGGLFTALKASDYGLVTVLTKQKIEDTNTYFAQGGIAVALDEQDSPKLHREDTLQAGAGLCDEQVVDILVNEGPARVGELLRMGARFDRDKGNILFTREAAHSRSRVIHASDATGSEIQNTLIRQCGQSREVKVVENCFVLDLLTNPEGRCIGALTLDRAGRMAAYLSRVTVLATGGAGQLFLYTTNPPIATGDGMAAAYRAGAQLMDLEFIQFHPTALAIQGAPRHLISEAVRGEGGVLVDQDGKRFMDKYDPAGELAPRDIVARAIWTELGRGNQVYLDVSHLGTERVRNRFPNITRRCLDYGVDPTTTPIPVAPAAHYTMSGVRTGSHGQTNIPGLYACGEVACNGVHGANRLASNSLLDGLVFGDRIVRYCLAEWITSPFWARRHLVEAVLEGAREDWETEDSLVSWGPDGERPIFYSWEPFAIDQQLEGIETEEMRQLLQSTMWEEVGLVRGLQGLLHSRELFQAAVGSLAGRVTSPAEAEVFNMAQLDRLIAGAALIRTESRGAHYRSDFPRADNQNWERHLVWARRKKLKNPAG
ncbi:MAG: L-aspartate oxidase [Firmicutes bacterium]|nr:L-aspartate oxidase [Bacillota bacterium]